MPGGTPAARRIYTDVTRVDFSAPIGNLDRITGIKLPHISTVSQSDSVKALRASHIYSCN